MADLEREPNPAPGHVRQRPNHGQEMGREATATNRFAKYLDIGLRLPLLFLMDQIILHDMGVNFFDTSNVNGGSHFHFRTLPSAASTVPAPRCRRLAPFSKAAFFATFPPNYLGFGPKSDLRATEDYSRIYSELYGNPDWEILPHFLSFFIGFNVYLWSAFLLVALTTNQLIGFYNCVASVLLVPLSFFVNRTIVSLIVGSVAPIPLIMTNYAAQAVISFFSAALLRTHRNNNAHFALQNVVLHSTIVPSILALYEAPPHLLHLSVTLSAFPALIVTMATLAQSFQANLAVAISSLKSRYQIIHDYGLSTFFDLEWGRLNVPSLLRTFWWTRVAQQLAVTVFRVLLSADEDISVLATIKYLATRGCETFLAVLGMTSVVSSLCHYVGSFFHWVLNQSHDSDEEKSIATVSAILYFVLAYQTGLTSLKPNKRFVRIYKNLFLVLTALFHFIHNMASPALIGLATSSIIPYGRHLRAIGVCLFLVVAPAGLMITLWKNFNVGTWLLSVTAFCVEVIVKVLVTVTVYALLQYDSHYRDGMWEGLDDAVYFVKAAGNSVEFCFAVFLFFNGGWILFFEDGGTIRALMLLVHVYCNIWCEAKMGWKTFMKRRAAADKIKALPDAEPSTIREYDDVCAICYMDMESAKVTKCNHMFHGSCLRKWLYLQDTCPLCHSPLIKRKEKVESEVIDNDREVEDEQEEVEEDDNPAMEISETEEPMVTSSSASSSSLEEDGDSDLFYDSMEEYRRELREIDSPATASAGSAPRRLRSRRTRRPDRPSSTSSRDSVTSSSSPSNGLDPNEDDSLSSNSSGAQR